MLNKKHLVLLACSATKVSTVGALPAVSRYDGPTYRILRSFLRQSYWPNDLSVGILSAKYGLIGGLAPIEDYDQRMDEVRANELCPATTETLLNWVKSHNRVSLVLGKDYLQAIPIDRLGRLNIETDVAEGGIGIKLHYFKQLLEKTSYAMRPTIEMPGNDRPLYFLPDWDDVLDTGYDFENDIFSAESKKQRVEQHCVETIKPRRMCDGVLVSLAQHLGSKGVLKKFAPTDVASLAPRSLREEFGLSQDQWMFGDCGAFTYVNEPEPTITPEKAIAYYQLYGFDFGASVDHIPVDEIATSAGEKRKLSDAERAERVAITQRNAQVFIQKHRESKSTFIPVGIIQGIMPTDYATQLLSYHAMGYKHYALGGLVFKTDGEILEIVREIDNARRFLDKQIWIHLFGIFRPKIQPQLQALRITSFDSATYFRKAWLRSDQNYLGVDGNWYAAIRVPMTSDPRTLKKLLESGKRLDQIQELEGRALRALHEYGRGTLPIKAVLEAVGEYDSLLDRNEAKTYLDKYRRTLEAKPWENCNCPICQQIGIDVLIFRGYNRNKRRGAHNTLMLYEMIDRTGRA